MDIITLIIVEYVKHVVHFAKVALMQMFVHYVMQAIKLSMDYAAHLELKLVIV